MSESRCVVDTWFSATWFKPRRSYAEAFEAVGALHRLDDFASRFGAEFYGLPRNQEKVTLTKQTWTPPAEFAFGSDTVVALTAGQTLSWRLQRGAME